MGYVIPLHLTGWQQYMTHRECQLSLGTPARTCSTAPIGNWFTRQKPSGIGTLRLSRQTWERLWHLATAEKSYNAKSHNLLQLTEHRMRRPVGGPPLPPGL